MPHPDERRYQVFVSSTFLDLQEHRQKVLQAVLEKHAFPAGMEMFPSADEEQFEFIKREIESSDYYIVIVGGKYGSVAGDGMSFTEKEFDYAVSLGKYVMRFLARDLHQLKGEQLEEDQDKRVKLQQFREKVSSGKLARFYTNPDELKSQVLHALGHAFDYQPQEGWVRGKNSRRIEDLENITQLQKRVMDLELELRKLQSDPTAPFASGDDSFSLELELLDVSPPLQIVDTWNRLLHSCFGGTMKTVSYHSVIKNLAQYVSGTAVKDAGDWTADKVWEAVTGQLLPILEKQFMGLGLIDEWSNGRSDGWMLTEKGRLQILEVSGVRRQHASTPTNT